MKKLLDKELRKRRKSKEWQLRKPLRRSVKGRRLLLPRKWLSKPRPNASKRNKKRRREKSVRNKKLKREQRRPKDSRLKLKLKQLLLRKRDSKMRKKRESKLRLLESSKRRTRKPKKKKNNWPVRKQQLRHLLLRRQEMLKKMIEEPE